MKEQCSRRVDRFREERKLVESAQTRWRAIPGAHLVTLVRAGARFDNGVLAERREDAAA